MIRPRRPRPLHPIVPRTFLGLTPKHSMKSLSREPLGMIPTPKKNLDNREPWGFPLQGPSDSVDT